MFNLFKKQKTTEIVEKEILVHSRLNFAHDPDSFTVFKFYLKPSYEDKISEMKSNNVFICNGVAEHIAEESICPIFKMPKKLPATRMISTKKIICIGSIVINNTTKEILRLDSRFTGMSLEEINEAILNISIDNDTLVSIMNTEETVQYEIVEGDDIDFETFETSVTLNNVLTLVMNEEETTND